MLHTISMLVRPRSLITEKLYLLAVVSIVISYGIVLFKAMPRGAVARAMFLNPRILLKNSNAVYLLLALVFWEYYQVVKYLLTSLQPFAIYSFFHALGYFNNTLARHIALSMKYRQMLVNFYKKYNDASLYMAANCELYILIQLIGFNLRNFIFISYTGMSETLRTATITAIFGAFIRLRYLSSPIMRSTVAGYDMRISQLLYSFPNIPVLPGLYRYLRSFVMG